MARVTGRILHIRERMLGERVKRRERWLGHSQLVVMGVTLEVRENAMEGDDAGEISSLIKVSLSPDIKPVWICVGRTVLITDPRFTEAGGTIVTCILNAPLRLVETQGRSV